jgi:hypothetical protein
LEAWLEGIVKELPAIDSLQLPELPDEKSAAQKEKIAPTVLPDRSPYPVYPTDGSDKACALHALFGNLAYNGMYRTPNARQKYVDQFEADYAKYRTIISEELCNLLKDYLSPAPGKDPHAKSLFDSMPNEMKELKICLAGLQDISATESAYIQFVENPAVLKKYLDHCKNESYFFSDCEIAIAAHLFHKRVHLLAHPQSGSVHESYVGPADGELIHISHKGDHYSRWEGRSI